MAYPTDKLTTGSSQEDIMRALQETVAQMVAEGLPQEQAQAQATQMAKDRTAGGGSKLMQARQVGALRPPGAAGSDAGLMGSTGQSGGYSYTGSNSGGRYGA